MFEFRAHTKMIREEQQTIAWHSPFSLGLLKGNAIRRKGKPRDFKPSSLTTKPNKQLQQQ